MLFLLDQLRYEFLIYEYPKMFDVIKKSIKKTVLLLA